MLLAKPLIVIVASLATLPLAIVATPLPLEVKALAKALTLIKVPVPLLTSGLALGNDVSLAIGTKPPTSSTRSVIRASIAAVVAILLSAADHDSPDCISATLPSL